MISLPANCFAALLPFQTCDRSFQNRLVGHQFALLSRPHRRLTKCVASWLGTISVPLAYLDGFDSDFAQGPFLDLRICCWFVHLGAYFSVAELAVQTRQIFHLSYLLHKATTTKKTSQDQIFRNNWLQSNTSALTRRVGAFGATFRLLWWPKNVRSHLMGFSGRCCIIFESSKQVTWTTSRRPQNPAEDTTVQHFILQLLFRWTALLHM